MYKILILSNDPIWKQKNIGILTEGGFDVSDVPDALEGLLMVDKNGFDAFIIDEELLDIDGYRACQKIRQYSEKPIILIGTEAVEEIWGKVNDIGFDAYLKKPVGPRELLAQLRAILRRTKLQEEQPLPEKDKTATVTTTPEIEPVQIEKVSGPTAVQPEVVQEKKPSEPQLQGIICPHCKVRNPEPQKFCGSCGIRLNGETKPALVTLLPEVEPVRLEKTAEAKTAEIKPVEEEQITKAESEWSICPSCGAKNPLGSQTCTVCRAILEEKDIKPKDTPFTPLPKTGPLQIAARPTVKQPQTAVRDNIPSTSSTSHEWQFASMSRLIDALAKGKITELNPAIDTSAPGGFSYPEVDRLLGTSGDESMKSLEALTTDGILTRKPFEKLKVDPEGSCQLVPVERCPYCDSGKMINGQLIEHFSCGNVQLEQDYASNHKYTCPKCKKELKLLGTDYRYVGIQHRCLNCENIFPSPLNKWRNLTTGKLWFSDELRNVELYSYSLNPDKRDWLEFQLKPKAQLVDFLRLQGYQVEELAEVHGSSGAVHTVDILATRDDSLAKFRIGIGVLTALPGEHQVGLGELFKFDSEAYDMGLVYKVVIALPKLSPEATKYAERQNIGICQQTSSQSTR